MEGTKQSAPRAPHLHLLTIFHSKLHANSQLPFHLRPSLCSPCCYSLNTTTSHDHQKYTQLTFTFSLETRPLGTNLSLPARTTLLQGISTSSPQRHITISSRQMPQRTPTFLQPPQLPLIHRTFAAASRDAEETGVGLLRGITRSMNVRS